MNSSISVPVSPETTSASPSEEVRPARSLPSAVRSRLLFKITLPYVALATMLALAALFVVARMQSATIAESFGRQISDAHLRVADSVARTEQEQLAHARTLTRLNGLAVAARAGNVQGLLNLLAPYATSQQIERIVVVSRQGRPLVALQLGVSGASRARVLPTIGEAPIVQAVLSGVGDARGDKFIAIMDDDGTPVLFTAAPIYDESEVVGVLLNGTSIPSLVQHWRTATLADVTLYAADGTPIGTSFGADLPASVTPGSLDEALVRRLTFGSRQYGEVVTPLVLRSTATSQLLGVALPSEGQTSRLRQVEYLLLLVFAVGISGAILLGVALSRRITRPIRDLVAAAEGVASGDLNQQLAVKTKDEVGALTKSFNTMVAGLQERERIRDVFGRLVSPPIARHVLGHSLDLSGETKQLTILFSDLCNFTGLTEQEEPAVVIASLNAYLRVVVESAERYGGIVNKFGGDSTLVLFGLTDEDECLDRSARAALRTALAIRQGLQELNEERIGAGLPTLQAGIGINTGSVVAGLIGAERRMEYTVIGDAVNQSARIQALSRDFDSDIVLSETTYAALGELPGLTVVDRGPQQLKGKQQRVGVYTVIDWNDDDATL